jgi:hypothetical protein
VLGGKPISFENRRTTPEELVDTTCGPSPPIGRLVLHSLIDWRDCPKPDDLGRGCDKFEEATALRAEVSVEFGRGL